MTRPVLDLVLFTNVGVVSASIATWKAAPPLKTEVDLGQGVTLGPVHEGVADYVFDLCYPHALKTKPVRGFRALYAFSRRDDADQSGLTWDREEYITTAMAMSRVAHPTSVGFEYSARLFLGDDETTIAEAVTGPIKHFGSMAFVTDNLNTWRNWLTDADAKLTRALMDAFYASQGSRPRRITRAIWAHENAQRTFQLDLRWPMIVTGLEALINVDDSRSTQQFRTRTVGLAERFGQSWSDDDARAAYRLRSKLTHGQRVGDTNAEHHALYMRMEAVLRSAVREALLDADFAAVFADDDTIRKEWALPRAEVV